MQQGATITCDKLRGGNDSCKPLQATIIAWTESDGGHQKPLQKKAQQVTSRKYGICHSKQKPIYIGWYNPKP